MQPKRLPWFRLYASTVDDPDVRLLAYEDRWHFVALLCLKAQGVLDAGDHPDMLRRKVAVKLGLQLRELEAAADRIAEVGLIDAETFQPLDWNRQQFVSDTDPTATERKQRQRDKERKRRHQEEQRQLNQQLETVTDVSHVTSRVTVTNVTRTETDTETDTEKTTTPGTCLDWSASGLEGFTEKERVEVVRRLDGHEPQVQQALLDELAGCIEDKAVKNSPIGLLAKLAAAARAGDFVLNRGRRVRDARIAKANPAPTQRRPGQDPETPCETHLKWAFDDYNRSDNSDEAKARLKEHTEFALRRWPEEASKFLANASARGKCSTRQPPRDNPKTQGASA